MRLPTFTKEACVSHWRPGRLHILAVTLGDLLELDSNQEMVTKVASTMVSSQAPWASVHLSAEAESGDFAGLRGFCRTRNVRRAG